jgi:hypothetical protein
VAIKLGQKIGKVARKDGDGDVDLEESRDSGISMKTKKTP